MSYLILNLVFLLLIGVCLVVFTKQKPRNALWLTLIVLLVITALFDSLFIVLGIFEYEASKILNLFIWKAPVEDFAYTVASVFIVGLTWEYFEKKRKVENDD